MSAEHRVLLDGVGERVCFQLRGTQQLARRAASEREAQRGPAVPPLSSASHQERPGVLCQGRAVDGVPRADFKGPPELPNPKDSSGAACAAGGLLVLASQLQGAHAEFYRAGARRILAGLTEHHADWDGSEALLQHGCTAYSQVSRGYSDTPLIYGDYFYLEALLMLNGRPGLL